MKIELRDYQHECIDVIGAQQPGAYLIKMATGMGKTVTFANVPRKGKMLILSHREELVNQPLKYFDCKTGIEQATHHADQDAQVVSASVQSISRRLDWFEPDAFDTIICDEAHHAAASTYRKIFDYFKPRMLLGFTATPNRSDNVRLNDVFSKIIFDRDLKWGIKNGYLSDIFCRRVNIGYDLRGVHTSRGDYAPGELEQAMDGTADAIADAYERLATGATLIFSVSVNQCHEIAKRIPGAVVVTGETKNRAGIIEDFTQGKIPCIVNCMVFTEGTDIPRVETVIIARPTKSDSLYTQMVGRGLRLFSGKERLNLIDCVGVSDSASLCTAPSLLGVDLSSIPGKRQNELEGFLFDLPDIAMRCADCPQSWIKNIQIVNLWAKEQKYNTHGVNYFKMPDGTLVCSLPERKKITISAADELGNVQYCGKTMPMQQALDAAFVELVTNYSDDKYIWDLDLAKRWGSYPATEKQIEIIQKKCKDVENPQSLTKLEASQILNRIFAGKKKRGAA